MEIIQKQTLIAFLVIFIIGLTPILWFKGNQLILDPDSNFRIDPNLNFITRLFVWDPSFQAGSDYSINTSTVFFYGLQSLLSNFFSLQQVEMISYVILFMLPGFGILYLMSQLFPGKEDWILVTKIVAVTIYMLNFYMLYIWPRLFLGTSALILMPVYLGILIKWFQGRIDIKKDLALATIATIVCTPIGLQPPLIFSMFIVLFFGYLVFGLNDPISNIKKMIILTMLFALMSAFWMLPTANYVIESGYTEVTKAKEIFDVDYLVGLSSIETSLLNNFRMHSDFTFRGDWNGQPYMVFYKAYETDPYLIAFSFLLPLIFIISLLIYRNKIVMCFSALAIIILFLSKGVHEPFKEIFVWLFTNIPVMWVYRAPWQKFGLIFTLSSAIIGGYFIGKIYSRLKENHKSLINKGTVFLLAFLIIYAVYMKPLILGEMLPESGGTYGYHETYNVGFHKAVPEYIFESAKWINSNKDIFGILLLPDDRAQVYNWGYAATMDVSLMVLDKKLIFRQYGEGQAPPNAMEKNYAMIVNEIYNNKDVSHLLGLFNIKYILQRNDFRYNFFGDSDGPEFIKKGLELQKEFELWKSFGSWDFYKIRDDLLYPQIYAANKIILYNSIEDILSTNFGELKNPVLLSVDPKTNALDGIEMHDVSRYPVNITVQNNLEFNYNKFPENIIASYYSEWKYVAKVINESEFNTTMEAEKIDYVLIEENSCESFFNENITDWNALNSTLIYFKTSENELEINTIKEKGERVKGVIGIWWTNGCIRRDGGDLVPLYVPPFQKGVIQINHKVDELEINMFELNKTKLISEEKRAADVQFYRINPTKYIININTTDKFILVFSENFNTKWKLKLDNEKQTDPNNTKQFLLSDVLLLFSENYPEEYHLKVNGYANGWIIDPNEFCNGEQIEENKCNIDLILYYEPQSYFYLGIIISAITVIAIILFILYLFSSRRYVK